MDRITHDDEPLEAPPPLASERGEPTRSTRVAWLVDHVRKLAPAGGVTLAWSEVERVTGLPCDPASRALDGLRGVKSVLIRAKRALALGSPAYEWSENGMGLLFLDAAARVGAREADLASAISSFRRATSYGATIDRSQLDDDAKARLEHALGVAAHHLQAQKRLLEGRDKLRRLSGGDT